MTGCDVQLVMRALRDYFQPDTFGRIFTQMDRFMTYTRTEQPIEKFLMEFGILRQKAEKLMFPSGGRFEDLFVCFQCIKAARLTPNQRTLLMASLGGSVDFSRMKQQLRQLFHQSNSVTKEDVFSMAEETTASPGEDLSYEAWAAYRKNQKQNTGASAASRSSSKNGKGKKSKSPKGEQEKMDLIGALGNATAVMAAAVNSIFYPNAPRSRTRRRPLRRPLLLRTLDRPFPPLPWRILRRMST